VSIARALMNGGQVILADEPTGALDSKSGQEVIGILRELHAQGHTIIIVTHDMQVASCTERIIEIADGVIVGDRPNVPTCRPSRRPRRRSAMHRPPAMTGPSSASRASAPAGPASPRPSAWPGAR
jgi:macrolide transport system ATP-binding/permease protein